MSARGRETHVPVGPLVAALGALLLIASLFTDWYEGLSGFTVFEFNDLLLTGLALAMLVALATSMGLLDTALRPTVAFGIALLGLLVVLSQLVNDPPAVAGDGGRDQDTGIWLALAGSALMVAGAALSTVRLAITVEPRGDRRAVVKGSPAVPGAGAGPGSEAGPASDEAPTVADEPPPRP